jgi:hypothetical protein
VSTFRDPKTIPGTEEWLEANAKFTRNMLRGVEGDCSLVADKLPHFKEWCAKHSIDWDSFCGERLLIKSGFLDKIEEGVRILRAGGHAGPISKADAVAAHARELAASEDVQPLGPPAPQKDGPSPNPTGKTKVDNINHGQSKGGTGAEYLVRRLKRDAPEVAAQLAQGAFKSARAAAVAAGIVKVATRVETAVRAIRKMTDPELYEFEECFNREIARRRGI